MAVDRLQKCIQLLAAGAERRRKILRASPVLGQHRPSGAAQGVIRIAALPLPAGPPARAVLANRLRRSVEDLRRIRVGILHGGGCQDGIVQPQERIGRHLQLRAQPLLLCCAAGMPAGVAVAAPPAPQWMLLPQRAGTFAPPSDPAARQRPRLAAAPPNSGERLSDAARDTPHRCRGKTAL